MKSTLPPSSASPEEAERQADTSRDQHGLHRRRADPACEALLELLHLLLALAVLLSGSVLEFLELVLHRFLGEMPHIGEVLARLGHLVAKLVLWSVAINHGRS